MRSLWCVPVCLALAGPGAAEPLVCADPIFTVEAADIRVAARACDAAQLAQTTLGSCDLAITRPVRIEVARQLSRPNCRGIYHCGQDRLEVLSPDALTASMANGPFGALPAASHWQSVIVHEIAHAAYDTVECAFSSCLRTSEYFAYVIQISSLTEVDRQAFEAATSVTEAVSRDRLSAFVAMMAPDRFAGLAWAYFSQRPDACGHLKSIMDGRVFFDAEPL